MTLTYMVIRSQYDDQIMTIDCCGAFVGGLAVSVEDAIEWIDDNISYGTARYDNAIDLLESIQLNTGRGIYE